MSVVPPGSRLVLRLDDGEVCELLTIAEAAVSDWAVLSVVSAPGRVRPVSGEVELVTPDGVVRTPARWNPEAGRLTLSMPDNVRPLQRRSSLRRQLRVPLLGTATLPDGERVGFRGTTIDLSDSGLRARVSRDWGGELVTPLTDVFAGLLIPGRAPVGLGLRVIRLHGDMLRARFTFIGRADMAYLRARLLATR